MMHFYIQKNRRIKAVALQYKVVSKYDRAPKLLSKHSFKFDLHKSSTDKYSQHNIMVENNIRSSLPVCSFYCVPRFVEYNKLYEYLKNGAILENSYFLKPSSKIIDSKDHYVKFDNSQAYQCSDDPKSMEIYSFESLFAHQEPLCFEDLMKETYVDEKIQKVALINICFKVSLFC